MLERVYTSGLLRRDETTLAYVPHMAESYTISADGLVLTFKLRETMQWSDGVPITAHDFQWTFEQMVNPDNGFPTCHWWARFLPLWPWMTLHWR